MPDHGRVRLALGHWYVSNVSIIYELFMMLYYHSWMFYNHFIATLYHFLGLTYWPSTSCCFLLVFYIAGNQYQTESKHRETFCGFLWTRRPPMGESNTWGWPKGGTTHQGAPRWVVPTSVASLTPSSCYKFPNIPKTLGVNLDQKSRHRKAL